MKKPVCKMKHLLLLACSFSLFGQSIAQQKNNAEKKIDELIRKMTLEEKVGQMAQITLDVLGKGEQGKPFELSEDKMKDAIVTYKIGSVLNTSDNRAMTTARWNEIIFRLQGTAKGTRLGIPLIYGFDAIHGATYVAGATFFPQPIGQAATWNRKLVQDAASITAYESKAASTHWNFSPVLDLGTNPLWPRLWETFGEDPYLISEMGKATIVGYQNPLGSKDKIAACLKHYVGYSDPKTGKDRSNAWIPEHYLREYHLPCFKAGVDAGARTVMVNSAMINGIPTHINKHLLTDILKKEWGFSGLVVTDWQDIDNVYKRDKVAASQKEALAMVINAGVDMAMIPYEYKEFFNDLIALVKENKVSINRINDAVARILRVKYELNLFEQPTTSMNDYKSFGSEAFTQKAFDVTAESIVLLKNENNILPLNASQKILVTGPNANSMRTLNGGWSYSWQGEKTEAFAQNYHTIYKALNKAFGQNQVAFEQGVAYKMNGKYFEDSIVDIAAATKAAAQSDVVLVCVGENSYTEKPGDLNDLNLSDNQQLLIEAMINTGKPVVLVLNEGRPRNISHFEPKLKAIVQLFLPGNYGGDALADILYGKINPSGKLPITYPRYVNALANYIHKSSDEQSNPQGAYDYSADYNPLYDFGYGLSYTHFSYSNLTVNKNKYKSTDTLFVSVNVKNDGTVKGKEVIKVFVSDKVASLSPDVKRLRAFDKVEINAGENKTVQLAVPIKALAFTGLDNKQHLEKGTFGIQIENLRTEVEVNENKVW